MNTINIYLSSGEEFVDFGSKLKSDYLQSEETARLSKRLGKLINGQPAEVSCKEYLIDRLSLSRPDIEREEADKIVTEIMLGVDNYRRDYAAIGSPDPDEFTGLFNNYMTGMNLREKCSFMSNVIYLLKGFRGKVYNAVHAPAATADLNKLLNICKHEISSYMNSDITLTPERGDTIADRDALAELIATEDLGYYLGFITYNEYCLEDQGDEVHEIVTPYLAGLGSGATVQYSIALDGDGNGDDGTDKDRIKNVLRILIGVLVFALVAYLSITFLLPVISMAMPFLNLLLGVFLSGACVLYTLLISSFAGMLAYLLVDKIIEWYEKLTKNEDLEARKQEESSTKDKETNKNSNVMTTFNLTEAEFKAIQDLETQFESFADSKKDFRKCMIDFYVTQMPGTHPADAEEIVGHIYAGIHMYNENLKSALKTMQETGEVDFLQQLQDAGKDLDIKERYNIYSAFDLLLQTMEENNLDKNTMNFQKIVDSRKMPAEFVPAEEDISQLINKINDRLKNPSFIINNTESIKDMIANVDASVVNAESFISYTEETLKQKHILALCTVVASKQHKLEHLPSDTGVRQIAAGCAAGVDIKNVIDGVANGDGDDNTAWTVIKVILGALLLTTLLIAVIWGLSLIGASTFVAVFTALSGTVLAGILAALSTVAVVFGTAFLAYKIAVKAGEIIENKVIPWCKTIWKWIKDRWNNQTGDDLDNDSDDDSDNIRRWK